MTQEEQPLPKYPMNPSSEKKQKPFKPMNINHRKQQNKEHDQQIKTTQVGLHGANNNHFKALVNLDSIEKEKEGEEY